MIFNPRVVQLTGARIALLPPSDLAASAGNTQVSLTWTDPGDETSGGQVVAEWGFTRIVRKVGSAPANQNDGVIVVDSTVKNQYLSEPFVDTGLTNDTTYYYGAFACSASGAWSDGAFVSAVPVAATSLGNLAEGTLITIKENGAPVEFYVAKQNYEEGLNGDGRTLVVRKDVHSDQVWDAENVNAYAESDIDAWFNGTYKNTLSRAVQTMIGTTEFYYTLGNNHNSVSSLERAVFALSLTELGYSHLSANTEGSTLPVVSALQVAYLNGNASSHWTRSPVRNNNSAAWKMTSSGGFGSSGTYSTGGARPAFTLPSTARVSGNLALIEEV